MNTDKEFLGREPINKLLWKLAVPTVIAQLVNMLYNIVDRIYIGHIPGEGAQPISSYNYGAKNADRVKETFLLLFKGMHDLLHRPLPGHHVLPPGLCRHLFQ